MSTADRDLGVHKDHMVNVSQQCCAVIEKQKRHYGECITRREACERREGAFLLYSELFKLLLVLWMPWDFTV